MAVFNADFCMLFIHFCDTQEADFVNYVNKNARMRAVEAEYKCRLHKLTLKDRHTLRHSEPGVSREALPLKITFSVHLRSYNKVIK